MRTHGAGQAIALAKHRSIMHDALLREGEPRVQKFCIVSALCADDRRLWAGATLRPGCREGHITTWCLPWLGFSRLMGGGSPTVSVRPRTTCARAVSPQCTGRTDCVTRTCGQRHHSAPFEWTVCHGLVPYLTEPQL